MGGGEMLTKSVLIDREFVTRFNDTHDREELAIVWDNTLQCFSSD